MLAHIIEDRPQLFDVDHVRRGDLCHDRLRDRLELLLRHRLLNQRIRAGRHRFVAAEVLRTVRDRVRALLIRHNLGLHGNAHAPVRFVLGKDFLKVRDRLVHVADAVDHAVNVRRRRIRRQANRARKRRAVAVRVLRNDRDRLIARALPVRFGLVAQRQGGNIARREERFRRIGMLRIEHVPALQLRRHDRRRGRIDDGHRNGLFHAVCHDPDRIRARHARFERRDRDLVALLVLEVRRVQRFRPRLHHLRMHAGNEDRRLHVRLVAAFVRDAHGQFLHVAPRIVRLV